MNKQKQGLMWAVSAAVISGLAVFVNGLVVKGIDPLVHTTIKNVLVGLLVVGVILFSREREKVKKLTRSQWGKLLGIAVIGGSLSFALFFTGLKQVGGVEGQIINKTLVVWVALLAVPFLKEKMTGKMAGGILLIYASSLLGGDWKSTSVSLGHAMILGATLMWAIETILVKKTLKEVPTNIAVGARMGIGSLILIGLLIVSDKAPLVTKLTLTQWGLLLVVGLTLFAYVMSWYRALAYLPATLVSSILVGAVVVTNMLNSLFVSQTIKAEGLVQAGMILGGIYLVFWASRETAWGERQTTFWKPKIS